MAIFFLLRFVFFSTGLKYLVEKHARPGPFGDFHWQLATAARYDQRIWTHGLMWQNAGKEYHYLLAIFKLPTDAGFRLSVVGELLCLTLPRCIVPSGRAQPLRHEPYQGSWPMERRRLNAPWHFDSEYIGKHP